MKLLVISMSVLLMASFSLVPAFAETEQKNPQPAARAGEPARVKNRPRKRTTDVKAQADANAVAEPNAGKRKSWQFDELDEPLRHINRQGQKEIREWTRGKDEGRAALAKTVQKQIIAELNFIRNIAAKEGAAKTTEAIDRLLASRRERLEKITEKAEEARERLRRKGERTERRDRDRQSRSMRSREGSGDQVRDRDRDDRSSRRKRPRRRDKKPQEDSEEY